MPCVWACISSGLASQGVIITTRMSTSSPPARSITGPSGVLASTAPSQYLWPAISVQG